MRFIVLLIITAIALAVGPLATIWAVNVLFGTSIPYGLQTWAAMLLLIITVNYQRGASRGNATTRPNK